MSKTEMNNVDNNPKFGIGLGIIKDEVKNINSNQNYSSYENLSAENKTEEKREKIAIMSKIIFFIKHIIKN